MKIKLLYNPFETIPDKLLMLVGIISLGIGTVISYYSQVIFDGIFDAHEFPGITFIQAFAACVVNIVVVCILLFALGKIINPKTRMIDILNTSFLSRIPIYIISIIIGLPLMKKIGTKITENLGDLPNLKFETSELIFLLAFSFFSLFMLVYSVIILVNGFRTATNAKKWQQYFGFAIVIIIAEIASKFIISYI